ncbi:MAG: M56 family metallopeptidase [Planctomycetota bacterium]
MSAALLEYALGNTLLAAPLAALAWALGRSGRCPAAAHLAWALVLVRLVMPPVADSPWFTLRVPVAGLLGSPPEPAAATAFERLPAFAVPPFAGGRQRPSLATPAPAPTPTPTPASAAAVLPPVFGPQALPFASEAPRATAPDAAPLPAERAPARQTIAPTTALAFHWLAGAALVAGWSLWRVVRFHRLLAVASAPAGPALVRLATQSARELRMPAGVRLRTTSARTSPFVWWCFGRPTIVLPQAIVADLPERELRLAISHELAHVRRRDHVLRWFEWAATSWLWWNPLAWLARRGLRTQEELACDATVLRALAAEPRDYGSCLLSVAESLSSPGVRPPAQACAMSDGGSLEQRIEFIMSDSPRQRPAVALHALPLAAAFASLCFGVIATAQEPAAKPVRPAAPVANGASRAADETPVARTLRTTVADAKALDVATIQGDVTVQRDAAAKGVAITATIRRAAGNSGPRLNDQEFAACVDGAKLAVDKDDAGKVTARVVFPDAPGGASNDDAAGRSFKNRRDNSCIVEFAVRADRLQQLVAATVSGDIRSDGDVGPVELDAISGNIAVHGAASAVRAHAVSGDVEVLGATGAVSATTISGKVRIELAAEAQGDVLAEATSGSVALQLHSTWEGEYRVESALGSFTSTIEEAGGAAAPPAVRSVHRARAGSPVEDVGTIGDRAAWRGRGAKARLATVTGDIRMRIVGPAGAVDRGGKDAEAAAAPTHAGTDPFAPPEAPAAPEAPALEGAPAAEPPAPAPAPAPATAPEDQPRGGAGARQRSRGSAKAARERAVVQGSDGRDGSEDVDFEAVMRAAVAEAAQAVAAARDEIAAAMRSSAAATREAMELARAPLADAAAAAEQAEAAVAQVRAEVAKRTISIDGIVQWQWPAAAVATAEAKAQAAATKAAAAVAAAIEAAKAAGEAPADANTAPPPADASPETAADYEAVTVRIGEGGAIRVERERRRADGTVEKASFEPPTGVTTFRLGNEAEDRSVRIEVEQPGPDGARENKVYEAPDLATFLRLYPGVLRVHGAADAPAAAPSTPRDRTPKRAK